MRQEVRKLIGEMEFTEDIIVGESHYAGENDDRLLAEMAAGHVDELSVVGRLPRKSIQVPIVELAGDEDPECCCNIDPSDSPEPDVFETTTERDAMFAMPETDSEPDSRPESPAPMERAIVEPTGESGDAASILAQLCWAAGGCGAGGLLYWLLLA